MPRLVSHPEEVKVVSRRFGQGATDIDRYIELDGYKAVRQAIEQGPDWIIAQMKASNLRGRGGAGFPTGMKWSFVPKQSEKPKYVLVNGDESEPGTCKDHLIFLHDPHAVIEGTIIAGLAIGAKLGFHLSARRVSLPAQDHGESDCRCLCQGISRQRNFRFKLRL